MTTQAEYAAVANALEEALTTDEQQKVPPEFRGMIPADLAQQLATQLAKVAVDTLDAYRAKETAQP